MQNPNQSFRSAWQERLGALKNIPPVLRIVWQSGPSVVTLGMLFRILLALLPPALLWVTARIIQGVVDVATSHQPMQWWFWWLVGAEFALAILAGVFSRMIDYYDSLLADRYSRYVSLLVMEHASQLDLSAYEDPVFYDRLERARVQATDRLVMIQSTGRLLQQIITTISLAIPLLLFSRLLLILLIALVVPAFLGESHFAFLGYANNFRQTAARLMMD